MIQANKLLNLKYYLFLETLSFYALIYSSKKELL